MFIQPTFLEELLLQRPDIEKNIKKKYQLGKKSIKKRLKLCESIEERISVLENTIGFIGQVWEREGVKFMMEVLDTPFDKINDGVYQNKLKETIDINDAVFNHFKHDKKINNILPVNMDSVFNLNEAILDDKPFYYPKDLSKIKGDFKLYENFNLIFPHFVIKAHSYKKPDDFYTTVAEIKYFKMYIFFLNRELSKYKEELVKTVKLNEDDYIHLNRADRKTKDGVTALGTKQTALFAQYLKTAHVILNENDGLSDIDAAKALQILTNLSYKQVRIPLGDEEKTKFKKDDFIKVKEALESMLKYVNDDLPKARK